MKSLKPAQGIKEYQVEEGILTYLNYVLKWYAWKNPTSGFYDPKRRVMKRHRSKFAIRGTSDIIGLTPNGQFIAIEVKTPKRINQKSATTKDQKEFIKAIEQNNGIAFLADSIDTVRVELKKRELI